MCAATMLEKMLKQPREANVWQTESNVYCVRHDLLYCHATISQILSRCYLITMHNKTNESSCFFNWFPFSLIILNCLYRNLMKQRPTEIRWDYSRWDRLPELLKHAHFLDKLQMDGKQWCLSDKINVALNGPQSLLYWI